MSSVINFQTGSTQQCGDDAQAFDSAAVLLHITAAVTDSAANTCCGFVATPAAPPRLPDHCHTCDRFPVYTATPYNTPLSLLPAPQVPSLDMAISAAAVQGVRHVWQRKLYI